MVAPQRYRTVWIDSFSIFIPNGMGKRFLTSRLICANNELKLHQQKNDGRSITNADEQCAGKICMTPGHGKIPSLRLLIQFKLSQIRWQFFLSLSGRLMARAHSAKMPFFFYFIAPMFADPNYYDIIYLKPYFSASGTDASASFEANCNRINCLPCFGESRSRLCGVSLGPERLKANQQKMDV